jgi:hypothetical protein
MHASNLPTNLLNVTPCVAQHADGTLYFSQVTSWYNSWWLVVDSDLETSWTPIYELDGSLGFDGSNGSIDVFWNDISSVQHTTGHVLASLLKRHTMNNCLFLRSQMHASNLPTNLLNVTPAMAST